ncbi:alpha-ketoglutarate-dependent dioxygenase AlkB family protein [Seonamhaeicola marinus]|uniref:Alpha-ketoglutarate-dependent dioxygenase AlkB n=1 Tax=Seonamhaeicola marinus TaxID=1912246 RepID=A0A5D0JAR8_9FLAO|nr:alpha-ketoglutarate-dependent dioxygenase AlkB [Seonamhaeicola marinus]TYA92210.1 alpha-ketoglutarate-dependent dioxygenase AlkB [Seonamhaeicola marinus]
MTYQKRLFDEQPDAIDFKLPDADVVLYTNFFSSEESNKLFKSLKETIEWQQDQVKFYGKVMDVPRLTALYGNDTNVYRYSGLTFYPKNWNEDLQFIKKRVESVAKVEFTSCLLNYYRDGRDSMDWHQDNEKELGNNPVIASVTFGAMRTFQLKHLNRTDLNRVDIPLNHGDFLLMQGKTQHFWKHKIPKTKKQIGSRINLTFRVIKH